MRQRDARPQPDHADFPHAEVELCPDGPMLLRHARQVVDEHGTVHPVERAVVAVCRCEKSSRMPWCDGTHKVIPRGGRS